LYFFLIVIEISNFESVVDYYFAFAIIFLLGVFWC